MKCPYCGQLNSKVVDSRLSRGDFAIRRRRECLDCNRRFTTYETVEELPLVVVKKDGRREEFSRKKVLAGVKRACEKLSVSMEDIEELIDIIERELREMNEKEIPSRAIGEKAMAGLQALDHVAYVRFASVYREFKDVGDFIDELKSLMPADKKRTPSRNN